MEASFFLPYHGPTELGTSRQRATPSPSFYRTLHLRDELSETDEPTNWRDSIDSFEATLNKALKEVKNSVRKLEKDLGQAIEYQSKLIDDLEQVLQENESEHADLKKRIDVLEAALATKDSETKKLERMSRRNNFRIVGIKVSPDENCEEIFKSAVLPKFGETPDTIVERCHRDGKGSEEKPLHILVRCLSYKDKIFIMRNRRVALANEPFFIVDEINKKIIK
ncbi:hypothetical protein HOLleu_43554 [Holothuria leucospilota]|uniref:Uncharacterized protein n=1 Tax=Holothuria leucospilota TaxID=206669 RepID=A0A9Q1BAP7_HOLLE|nr:hypothetical protein HOLleu_43554 [Holothuria leucospilota]